MDSIIWFINFSVMSSNKLEYELITKIYITLETVTRNIHSLNKLLGRTV